MSMFQPGALLRVKPGGFLWVHRDVPCLNGDCIVVLDVEGPRARVLTAYGPAWIVQNAAARLERVFP